MMKVLVVALIVCVLFIGAHGASVADVYDRPVYDVEDGTVRGVDNPVTEAMTGTDDGTNPDHLEPHDEDPLDYAPVRARRFSCDLLSFNSKLASPNHSACAIRCLAQLRKGGRCENRICKCRGKM